MMLTKKGLDTSTIVGRNEMELEEAQWAGISMRALGGDLVYIALYLLPGLGTSGANAGRLASLTSLIQCLKVPWLIAADWNQSPGSLKDMLELWNAVVLLPDGNEEATCLQGKGTCIDSVVCPAAFASKITVERTWRTQGPLEARTWASGSSLRRICMMLLSRLSTDRSLLSAGMGRGGGHGKSQLAKGPPASTWTSRRGQRKTNI